MTLVVVTSSWRLRSSLTLVAWSVCRDHPYYHVHHRRCRRHGCSCLRCCGWYILHDAVIVNASGLVDVSVVVGVVTISDISSWWCRRAFSEGGARLCVVRVRRWRHDTGGRSCRDRDYRRCWPLMSRSAWSYRCWWLSSSSLCCFCLQCCAWQRVRHCRRGCIDGGACVRRRRCHQRQRRWCRCRRGRTDASCFGHRDGGSRVVSV